MKKIILIIIIVFLVLAAFLAMTRLLSPEDTWLCQNGEWIKHGQPKAPQPVTPCSRNTADQIIVKIPKTEQTITSPLLIEGEARGTWYFEASFPIKLADQAGQIIAQGIATAQSDWMTEDFVPFKAELVFNVAEPTSAFLILLRDNPSGLPENDQQIKISLLLLPGETMAVKAYFNNNQLDPEMSCNKVFAVTRNVAKTSAVARAALEQLLAGPTDTEKAQDFNTSINSGVTIQSLVIENETAKVDFSAELEKAVGGSCRVSAIRAQITETLKQFAAVKEVIISIDGRTEDILQP
ncbi:MAG: GerMN domain-containing protein [bacterium]